MQFQNKLSNKINLNPRVYKIREIIRLHTRSALVVLFVAASLLLIALVSMVAWTYFNSLIPNGKKDTQFTKSQQDYLQDSSLWNQDEGKHADNSHETSQQNDPMFVHAKSSELNFDELVNTNIVNSDLMHDDRYDNIDPGQSMETTELVSPAEYRYSKTEETDENTSNQLLASANTDSVTVKNKIAQKQNSENENTLSNNPSEESSEIQSMKLYKIDKAVGAGAVCLDGSPPAYYHRPGIGPNDRSWIIHFNGGAWCFDKRACTERSRSSLGSTKKLPKSPPIVQGINSPNPTTNPDFYDWNLVWIVYCDGASFTGNLERPIITTEGDTIYMRGKRVINAILNDLMFNLDMKDAESIVLTGSSAGSMAAIFQADYIASRLPRGIPVKVLADAGYFVDTKPIGGKSLIMLFRKVYEMQNSSAGLNQDCIRQYTEEPWKCFLPAIATRFVKTPIYYLNSAYDIWSLIYFLGIDCKFPTLDGPGGKMKKRSLSNHNIL